jgi:hypothetical protein
MGAVVSLSTKAIEVAPGAEAACGVTIRNNGTVVDQFSVDVLGDAASWAAADPPTISLFPGGEGTTTVRFRPPRTATTPAGTFPFGVRVQSAEDPAGSAVEEGLITVGAFADLFAEIVPRTSRGRRSGSHEVALDNRGNTRLNATLEASDADQQLAFDVSPPGVVADPGTATFSKVRVKPRRRFWRGQPRTHPFKVAIAPESGPAINLDGSILQEAMLPRWTLPALLLAIAGLIAALVFWLAFLQPAIKSAATAALADAGITPIPSAAGGGGGTNGGGGTPAPVATPAGGGTPTPTPGGGTPTPTPMPTPSTGTPPPVVAGQPVDGRLATDGSYPNSAAFDSPCFLTDLVFANPNGRTGTLKLYRDEFVLVTLRLENFRDLDLHYVTPILVQPDRTLRLEAKCTGQNASPCDPSVYFSGFIRP